MKKTLMILGGLLIVLVLGVVAFIAMVSIKGSKLDKESKEYADTAIPAIITDWEMEELQQRASPEFNSAMKEGDWELLFAAYRRLGKLKEYKGCTGQANMSATQDGKVISANYVGTAEFETGPAEIELSLIKHGDLWQIFGFRVNSRVYLEQPS